MDFLDAAARIAARLATGAQWAGNACTWHVMGYDPLTPMSRHPVKVTAGPAIYQGTAGIALFLTELYALTGDRQFEALAEGALRFSVGASRADEPMPVGFHAGTVGIAYVLTRFSSVTGREEFASLASELLVPIYGSEHTDRGIDVISGSAGAIPALLTIATELRDERARASAIAFGNHLVRMADREPIGWSWSGMVTTHARNLTGVSHGAAGCGYALLELYAATENPAFRYAAEQAFAYETAVFDSAARNWPDFGSGALGETLRFPEARATLREQLRAGAEWPRYAPRCSTVWCHGAPGIGLTRLRAHELLSVAQYAAEAVMAIEATERTFGAVEGRGYSLCHGVFGNSELLMAASQHFGNPQWRRVAEDRAAEAVHRYELQHQPWPSGVVSGYPDPSLMLGDAGIGHFLLRLYSPHVPSVLLVTPPASSKDAHQGTQAEESISVDAMRRDHVDRYFGLTLNVSDRLDPPGYTIRDLAATIDAPSDVMAVEKAIERITRDLGTDARAALLRDASAVERARLELKRTLTDNTQELLEDLVRLGGDDVPWGDVSIVLAPHAQLVTCARDWEAWLSTPGAPPPEPGDEPVTFVVYRRNGRAQVRRVGRMLALVLDALRAPTTLDDLTAFVVASTSGDIVPDAVRARILAQLRQVYDAGVVTVANSLGAAAPAHAAS